MRPEELFEARGILRGGDDEDVADTRQHQGAQRVVDHGFVVDRQQLLGERPGGRLEPGAGAAGQNDAFAGIGGHACCSCGFRGGSPWSRRFKVSREFSQGRLAPIFSGQDGGVGIEWPVDGEGGVIPQQALVVFGGVDVRDFVEHFGAGARVIRPWAKPRGTRIWFQASAERMVETCWP